VPIIDNAIYRDGVRHTHPVTLRQTFEELWDNGGFAWIGLYSPTDAELH
jgi:magnesium transporter